MPKIFKQWIYHKTKKPQVINSDEFESFESQGWADSPAMFINLADFNVDPENISQVHQLGETVEGVKDAVNGALNIDIMSKKELYEYAKKSFNIEIDKRKSAKILKAQVKEMAGA